VLRYERASDPADVRARALALGGELSRAIDNREFVVRLQPIVDLVSGAVLSVEALTRWRHPALGTLAPARFLAAVERSGLLPAFDAAVLDQALSALVALRQAGIDVTVAVNAGPRTVVDPDFPRLVRAALARHGLTGQDLVVELTESITLADIDVAEPALHELRRDGVRLALDDFGTRASPLAMLTRLMGVDLKIDQSFVDTMAVSAEAFAVVKSTVDLGTSLGRGIVAEGIERDEQRRVLAELGCQAGQGLLFAAPLPIDELMAMVLADVRGGTGRLAAPL